MTTENSVLMNLTDLFVMEADRRAERTARVVREMAEAEARVEAERRAQEAEARAAAAEARLREEAERRARDAEADRRIHQLRAELDAVRTQREELRLRALEAATAPRAPRRSGWMIGSMAATSLVAACIAIFVAWPQHQVVMSPADQPDAIVEMLEEPSSDVEVEEVVAVEETAVEVAEVETPVVEEVAAVTRPVRPVRPRPPHTRQDDLSRQLDFDDSSDQVLSDDFLGSLR